MDGQRRRGADEARAGLKRTDVVAPSSTAAPVEAGPIFTQVTPL